jgi:hypothetical protein
MKRPPDVLFHDGINLFVWRPLGVVNEAAVNKILTLLAKKEATSRQPFNRFTDLSAQDEMELSFNYVFHVALFRRLTYIGRPPVKSAFYVTNPEVAHLVKIHAIMTDHSPLQVEMFEEREAAANWLGVSIDCSKWNSCDSHRLHSFFADADGR